MISIYNKSEQKISDNQQIIKISYKDMLEECASIHISTENGLPKHICFYCSKLLQQLYKLRIQCVISDRILKKCLLKSNDNSSIMVENDSTDGFDYQLADIKSVSSNSDIEEIMIEEHLDNMSGEQIITKTKMSSDIDQTELNQIKMSSNIDQTRMSTDSNQNDVHQTKMSSDVNRTKMSSDVNRTKMASNLNETKMSSDVNGTKMASNLNETKILNKELKCKSL
ncbi:uncharacterized protein LOC123294207 [Chrysoperla carnea]|uniref:uncharacterized protein LOC123294207 n=1 Tax=Chrysoperla carnea TaxID=189513 RepID=UPI001D0835F4|nr:uncharacterized protein LOC123294207 [Chrysoperla carnea]